MADASAFVAGRVDVTSTIPSGRDGADTRRDGPVVWRAWRTADGPVTARFVSVAGPEAGTAVEAWGPGAATAIAEAPALLGAHDDPRGFVPLDPRVRALVSAHPWFRIGRSGGLVGALIRMIVGQRVTWRDAAASWRGLLVRWGEPAPGPGPDGLRALPEPRLLARLPEHAFHEVGIEASRARPLRAVCAVAGRITRWDRDEAVLRLPALPGVGPWTVSGAVGRAFGDPDGVLLGDLHAPRMVQYALTGDEGPADDARMLELLAPFAGHRGRVTRLIELAGLSAPRRAPLPRSAHERGRGVT